MNILPPWANTPGIRASHPSVVWKWIATLFVLLGLFAMRSRAQEGTAIPLWNGGAPGALGVSSNDIPTLTPFLPQPQGSGLRSAVVVCPGGGYGGLAPHEGRDYALWLNQQGIVAFVLRYRLGSQGYKHPTMLHDALRAIRWVRSTAASHSVDPSRIGIMGSSAGGHLASSALTHFDAGKPNAPDAIDRVSSRPDFGILCYAVITMGIHTHQGSKNNLLGKEPSDELVRLMSNELQVTSNTPPCFIWHTWEDKAVKVENAMEFAAALQRNGVPFDLHIYQNGRHGIGLNDKPPFKNAHAWTGDLRFWLSERKLL